MMDEDKVGESSGLVLRVKSRRGRPCFTPSDAQRRVVASMANSGIPQEQIARRFGIAIPTLRKYFREELFQSMPKDS